MTTQTSCCGAAANKQDSDCGCEASSDDESAPAHGKCCAQGTATPSAAGSCSPKIGKIYSLKKNLLITLVLHALIISVWLNLETIADFLTYRVFGLAPGSHLAGSVHFFLKDMPFIFILLGLIVFWMGIVRTILSPRRCAKCWLEKTN
ncbi:hypothetical protein [Dongshaea marina]|uniref:hypothetical protein n=1 Tax=Dongshaea marina TaxID=2047966 RepID=UPI0019007496|nr:hypothetical protein [Dongshaea marina]